MISDVNSAFLPDQSMLNFCSAARHSRSAADVEVPPTPQPVLPRTQGIRIAQKQVYETSHNRRTLLRRLVALTHLLPIIRTDLHCVRYLLTRVVTCTRTQCSGTVTCTTR